MTCKSLCGHPPNSVAYTYGTRNGNLYSRHKVNKYSKRVGITLFHSLKLPDSSMAQMTTMTEVPNCFLRFLNSYSDSSFTLGRLFLRPFETFYNYAVSFTRQSTRPAVSQSYVMRHPGSPTSCYILSQGCTYFSKNP
jgi:hypothetical protein